MMRFIRLFNRSRSKRTSVSSSSFYDPLRVLIVDSDLPSLAETQEQVKALYGDTVIDVVSEGHNAIQQATTEDYDLILMEVRLPNQQGLWRWHSRFGSWVSLRFRLSL